MINYYKKNRGFLPADLQELMDETVACELPDPVDTSWILPPAAGIGDLFTLLGSASREVAAWFYLTAPSRTYSMADFEPALYVYEESPEAFKALLEALDLSVPLAYGSLRLRVGGMFPELWLRTALADGETIPPGRVSPLAMAWAGTVITNVIAEREVRHRSVMNAPRRADKIAEDEARIGIQVTRHSTVIRYVAENLQQGFRDIGVEVPLVTEKERSGILTDRAMAATVADLDLDALISVSCQRIGIAPSRIHVNWVQDEMPQIVSERTVANLTKTDLTYTLARDVGTKLTSIGYHDVELLQFGLNQHKFYMPEDGDDQEREATVAHITHIPKVIDAPDMQGWSDFLEAKYALDGKLRIHRDLVAPFLDEAIDLFGWNVRDRGWALRNGVQVYRRLERIRMAEQMLYQRVPFALYGDGWQHLPRLKPFHRGQLTGTDALRDVLQRHKVVIHSNLHVGMHSRILEGFACGALVMSRRDPIDEVPDEGLIQIDPNLESRWTEEDMRDVLTRGLTDDVWRKELVAATRDRILADHTYGHRARKMYARILRALA